MPALKSMYYCLKNIALKCLLGVFALFIAFEVCAQTVEIDSLRRILPSLKGKRKVDALNKLSLRFINSDPEKTSQYVRTALSLAEKQSYPEGRADSYNIIGLFHDLQGNYPQALNHYLKSLEIYKVAKDKKGQANALLNIGVLYQQQGDIDKAITFYQEAMLIQQSLKNSLEVAKCLHNIGNAHSIKAEYEKGLTYLNKAIDIYIEFKNNAHLAKAYNSIANIYDDQRLYKAALAYYQKALKELEKIDDKNDVAICLNNIANVYCLQEEYNKALRYAQKSLEIAQSIGAKDNIKNAAYTLSQIYSFQEDYAHAFEYLNRYNLLERTMFNEENAKQIARFQATYDITQKENEIALLNKDNALKQVLIYGFSVVIVLVLALLGILLWAYRQKMKANQQLATQKDLIETKNKALEQSEKDLKQTNLQLQERSEELAASKEQLERKNMLIADKNKNMHASISYAQRIQEALLPPIVEIKAKFPELAIFYRPKDMVSGDFYWFAEFDEIYYLAAVDCTGHGVPGAFMSMIGHAFLNQILKIQHITEPGEILNQLHQNVIQALHHDTVRRQDGMEMVLCAINPQKKEIKYAGAVTPMLIFNEGKQHLIQGERQSIGGTYNFRDEDVPFTTQTFHYQSPAMVYMFSDGFQDQFGGLRGRKFGKSRFYELLHEIHTLPTQEQSKLLTARFEEWKKDNSQIDDVMVLGVKI